MGWIGDTVENCERMLDTAAANGYRLGCGRSVKMSAAIEKRAKPVKRTLRQIRYAREQILTLWSLGRYTQAEIALQVGCSKTTVSAVICRAGRSQRKRPQKSKPLAPDTRAKNPNRNFDPKRGG